MTTEGIYFKGAVNANELADKLNKDFLKFKKEIEKVFVDTRTYKTFLSSLIGINKFKVAEENNNYICSGIFKDGNTPIKIVSNIDISDAWIKEFKGWAGLPKNEDTRWNTNSTKNQGQGFIVHATSNYRLVYVVPDGAFRNIQFVIQMVLTPTDLKFLKDVIPKESWNIVARNIAKSVWNTKRVPVVFDAAYPIRRSKLNGVVKLNNGELFYIPEKGLDQRKRFYAALTEGQTRLPVNTFIMMDTKIGYMFCTNTDGELVNYSISGATKVTEENKVTLLEKTLGLIVVGTRNPSSCFAIKHPEGIPANIAELTSKYYSIPMAAPEGEDGIPEKDLFEILDYLDDTKKGYYPTLYNKGVKSEINPYDYFRIEGTLQAIIRNIKNYSVIKAEVNRRREEFDNATKDDVGGVPSISKLDTFFPHQAESIARLQHAGETAILDISTGGGKCCVSPTLIFIKDKGLVKIGDLFKDLDFKRDNIERIFPAKDIVMNRDNEYVKADRLFYGGIKKTRKIITDLGFELGGTLVHPILTLDTVTGNLVFKKVGDVVKGDVVALKKNQDCWGKEPPKFKKFKDCPTELTEELSRLLGWIISKGYNPKNNKYISIQLKSKKFLKKIKSLAETCFPKATVTFNEPCKNRNVYKLYIGQSNLGKFMRYLEADGLSKQRVIPWCILQAPKNLVTTFLKSLYEGDGGCEDKGRKITYSTISPILSRQLQVLLLNYGIVANKSFSYKVASNSKKKRKVKAFTVLISGYQQIQNFYDNIRFISKRKNNKIQKYLDQRGGNSVLRKYEEIPNIKHLVEDAYSIVCESLTNAGEMKVTDTLGRTQTKFVSVNQCFTESGGAFSSSATKEKGSVTTNLLRRIVDDFKSSKYRNLINNNEFRNYISKFKTLSTDFIFSKVVKLTKVKERKVYDFHVPNGHEFLSNGFISHNTLIILSEIAQLLKAKKIKRPLIVMPDNLIYQYINAIDHFTDFKINPFTLNTFVKGSWGSDEMRSEALAAPLNTIFLTSYPFIVTGREIDDTGIYFPVCDWLINDLEISYVALDEAHIIKNPKTKANQACMQLREAPYRRIATGTLIQKDAGDLPAQLDFLSPGILGTRDEFIANYALTDKKGRIIGYPDDAIDRIREVLRQSSYYLMYREYDWGASLPVVNYHYDIIKLTSTQNRVYRKIIEGYMDEMQGATAQQIQDLKNLGLTGAALQDEIKNLNEKAAKDLAAWDKFCKAQGENLDVVSARVLPKFIKLEQYVTAPDYDPFIRDAEKLGIELSEQDKISAKLPKIDALIDKSIYGVEGIETKDKDEIIAYIKHKKYKIKNPENLSIEELKKELLKIREERGNKVIVGVHYKFCAEHLWKHSRHKNIGVYYDAGMGGNLKKFIDNPETPKVIFAVVQSIREGKNLQMANRIIICDSEWTPGKVKQFIARIYRPEDPEKVKSGKTVHINYLIADQTVDVIKFARVTTKKINNARLMEKAPVQTPLPPSITDMTDLIASSRILGIVNGITADNLFKMDDTELREVIKKYELPINPNNYSTHELLVEEISYKLGFDPNRNYAVRDMQLDGWVTEKVEINRKDPNYKPVKVQHVANITGRLIKTPDIPGVDLPEEIDGTSLITYLQEVGAKDNKLYILELETGDYNILSGVPILKGTEVQTPDGVGTVIRVGQKIITVEFKDVDTGRKTKLKYDVELIKQFNEGESDIGNGKNLLRNMNVYAEGEEGIITKASTNKVTVYFENSRVTRSLPISLVLILSKQTKKKKSKFRIKQGKSFKHVVDFKDVKKGEKYLFVDKDGNGIIGSVLRKTAKGTIRISRIWRPGEKRDPSLQNPTLNPKNYTIVKWEDRDKLIDTPKEKKKKKKQIDLEVLEKYNFTDKKGKVHHFLIKHVYKDGRVKVERFWEEGEKKLGKHILKLDPEDFNVEKYKPTRPKVKKGKKTKTQKKVSLKKLKSYLFTDKKGKAVPVSILRMNKNGKVRVRPLGGRKIGDGSLYPTLDPKDYVIEKWTKELSDEMMMKKKKKQGKKEIKPRPPKPKDESKPDDIITLEPVLYNGFVSLWTSVKDPDAKKLSKLGFTYQGPFWYLKIRNKKHGYGVLSKLQKGKGKFKIKDIKQIEEIFEEMTKDKILIEDIPDIREFHKIKHRKATKGVLKVYPLVKGNNIFLCVDQSTNPKAKSKLSSSMFKSEPEGFWYFIPRKGTKSEMKQELRKIRKSGLTIDNPIKLKQQFKKFNYKNMV